MPEQNQRPTVVFRSSKTTPNGETSIEEREVSGCSPDELVELLSVPPFDPDDGQESSEQARVERFVEAVTDRIQDLEFRLHETRCAPGDTSFSFKISSHASEATDAGVRQEPSDSAGHLPGASVDVIVGGDDLAEEQTKLSRHLSRINVDNRGLLVVNKENIYAIVNVNLNLTIHKKPT